MNPPYRPLIPGAKIDQEWFDDIGKNTVRNVTGGGAARVSQAGADVNIWVGDSDSVLKSYLAIITGSDFIQVYNPEYNSVQDHPYRFRYAFSEVALEMRCIDGNGAYLDAEDCTPELAASDNIHGTVEYMPLEGGRSGTTSLNWAFNLSELTHPLSANSSTGEQWIWGRDIKDSFYPKLYRGVGVGSGWDNSHVQDVAVHMFEVMDKLGRMLTFFDVEGHHIGDC